MPSTGMSSVTQGEAPVAAAVSPMACGTLAIGAQHQILTIQKCRFGPQLRQLRLRSSSRL